ncbi:MAG: HEAT repeat domain-containing protein, partial [Planctomycetota bacterium]
ALSDSSPAVRFAAAMAVGETKYAPAEERLVRMAQDPEVEPDQNAGCAVLYALHELGNDEYTYALGRLLFDDDPGVRADAATVMGRIGEPTATGPLKTLLADEQDESVRLAARTALARLGDSESKVRLRAYVKGYFLDLRLAAIPALADINPPGAQADFRFLLRKEKSPRLRVAAAGALARLGTVDEQGYDLALRSLRRPREVLSAVYGGREIADVETESMQSLAAIALGYMGRQEAIPALHEVLDSDRGAVRVAAAMAILRITNAGMGAPRRGEDDAADAAEGPVEAAPAVRPRPRMHTAGGRD